MYETNSRETGFIAFMLHNFNFFLGKNLFNKTDPTKLLYTI